MRSRLDQIEARLRTFIESSAQLLPWNSRQNSLARQLVDAMDQTIQPAADGVSRAPSIYTITMHPDNLSFWQSRQDLFDSLARILLDAAREADVTFATSPVIRLAGDPSLTLDESALRILRKGPVKPLWSSSNQAARSMRAWTLAHIMPS